MKSHEKKSSDWQQTAHEFMGNSKESRLNGQQNKVTTLLQANNDERNESYASSGRQQTAYEFIGNPEESRQNDQRNKITTLLQMADSDDDDDNDVIGKRRCQIFFYLMPLMPFNINTFYYEINKTINIMIKSGRDRESTLMKVVTITRLSNLLGREQVDVTRFMLFITINY